MYNQKMRKIRVIIQDILMLKIPNKNLKEISK